MRLLRVLVCILLSGTAFSQALPTDPDTKKITWQEKIAVDSVTKSTLYERAQIWLGHYYKTEKFVPKDTAKGQIGKEEGAFPVKLTYDIKYKAEHNISYNIVLEVKEGRYRFTITNFKIYNTKTGPKTSQTLEIAYAKMSSQNKSELSTQVNKEINAVIEDLKKIMLTGLIAKKEDW